MTYTSRYTLPSFLDARILGRHHTALNHLKVSVDGILCGTAS